MEKKKQSGFTTGCLIVVNTTISLEQEAKESEIKKESEEKIKRGGKK